MNTNFSDIIVDKFTKKFIAAHKSLRGAGKNKVLKYSPVIFKRWYYSALVNETTLSPSFIHGANAGVSNTTSAPSVSPQMSGVHFKGFSIKENKYSVASHPVVDDIKTLLGFCMPDVELDEQDYILPGLAERITNFLSLSDPYYVEFLTEIAFELALLKKADAIYSNKAAISNNYTSFSRLNQEEALKKIVNAAIKLCSRKINESLPQRLSFVSEAGITELIKKPVPIDEIFKRIFRAFGLDIERLWDEYSNSIDDPNGERDAMLSSTFFLGIVLDKWFITPFGQYLKLIEPIYCFYYNFDEELGYLLDVISVDGDVDTALFSPCAFYSFTQLGRRFFASEMNEAEKKKRPLVPVSELLDLLNMDEKVSESDINAGFITSREIYSFKVKMMDDKRYWKQLDAADYNTLHELHLEIAINFDFSLSGYEFFTDESMSPFCAFSDPKAKNRQRKADKITIDEMNLKKGDKLFYVSDRGKRLEIELTKRIPHCRRAHYPQTVRESKFMRMMDESDF